MTYTNEIEFKKINIAFTRVKKDIVNLSRRLEHLEEENSFLRNLILKNKTSQENKVIIKDENIILIGNLESKKIHNSSCPYAKRIIAEKRIIFENLNDALKQKYIRCSCLGH